MTMTMNFEIMDVRFALFINRVYNASIFIQRYIYSYNN